MRLLLVENDKDFLRETVPDFERVAGDPSKLAIAKSRDSALAALRAASVANEFYDLVVLDQSIPDTDEDMDDGSLANGKEVFLELQEQAPRTPVYIFTTYSTEENVPEYLARKEQANVWGAGEISTVIIWRKNKLRELLERLLVIAGEIDELDQIEISSGGRTLELTPQQKRVLRVFVRRRQSCSCTVAPLNGGLSGASVYRITARDRVGTVHIVAAAKMTELTDVDDEVKRFDQHVNRLEPGTFPQKVEVVRGGAGRTAGVFYRLLDADVQPLFSLLQLDHPLAAATVRQLETVTRPWTEDVPTTSRTIRDIRRSLVKDEIAAILFQEYRLDWALEFEQRPLQAKWVCLHGDLHGGNVLVDSANRPLLIDFADIKTGPAPIDPLTLELSMLFHPDFKQFRGSWPSLDVAGLWADRHKYTQYCPWPDFVTACRDWTYHVAAGDREVYSSAYAYLLRQLKYPDTDKELALSMMQGVRQRLESTFG